MIGDGGFVKEPFRMHLEMGVGNGWAKIVLGGDLILMIDDGVTALAPPWGF